MLHALQQLSMPSSADFIGARGARHQHRNAPRRHGRQARSHRQAVSQAGTGEARGAVAAKKRMNAPRSTKRGRDISVQPRRGASQKTPETLNKVLTQKAPIAQTPKELVWTLNKAKLYRYTPVVPAEQRHPVPLLLVFALMNRPVDHGPAAGPQLRRVHGEAGLRRLPARLGQFRARKTRT